MLDVQELQKAVGVGRYVGACTSVTSVTSMGPPGGHT